MKIERIKNLTIKITDDDKGYIEEQSISSILLYEILQQLKCFKCATKNRKKLIYTLSKIRVKHNKYCHKENKNG